MGAGQTRPYQQALSVCTECLALVQQDNRHQLPAVLDSLARHLGRHSNAIACYRRAVELFEEQGERYRKAQTLRYAGDAYKADGDPVTAEKTWREALAILDGIRHPDADEIRARLIQVPARGSVLSPWRAHEHIRLS